MASGKLPLCGGFQSFKSNGRKETLIGGFEAGFHLTTGQRRSGIREGVGGPTGSIIYPPQPLALSLSLSVVVLPVGLGADGEP